MTIMSGSGNHSLLENCMKLMNRNGNMKLYSYERKVLMTYRFISSRFLQKTSEKRFLHKLLNKTKMSKRKQKKRIKTLKRSHFQSLVLVPILMIQILILRKS